MRDEKATKGQITKKKDIVHWKPEKIMAFIDFSQFFMKIGVYEGIEQHIYDCTSEKIEQMRLSKELYLKEFMTCLDGRDMTQKTFTLRLKNFVRNVSDALRENPSSISSEMQTVIKGNAKWEPCLIPKQKNIPAESMRSISPIRSKATALDHYNEGLKGIARIFEHLVSDIEVDEIRKIDVHKRIRLANNLTHSLSKAVKNEQNTKVFNTLMINSGNREELERAMLNYAENKNQEEGY